MKFSFKPNWKINTTNQWVDRIQKSNKKNVTGRSALSLAEFCNSYDVENIFSEIIRNTINEDVKLEWVKPEYPSKFDKYPRPRFHDLAVKGMTKNGKSVFFTVEAKVDEPFGGSLASNYKDACRIKASNKNSLKKDRIENMLSKYYPSISKDSKLQYQLMYATIGTITKETDINIMEILIFKTKKYNPHKGENNKKHFLEFINTISAHKINDNHYVASFPNFEKTLYINYEEIPFNVK